VGRTTGLILLVCIALALAGCGGGNDSSSAGSTSANAANTEATGAASTDAGGKLTKPKVEVPSGPAPTKLVSEDIVKGTGAVVKKGGDITVDYVAVDYKTGKELDSSWARGEPYSGTLGPGRTLQGWKLGIPGMRVGGRRELILPPDLAYEGENVAFANSTLVYVIDLLAAHK
jgi:peptidylprolyl isomerase